VEPYRISKVKKESYCATEYKIFSILTILILVSINNSPFD